MNNLPLPDWLLHWLCGDRVQSIRDGEANLRLARFPEGDFGLLALLVVAAGLAVIYFTYSREGALARWKKYSLASIRALLILLLALIVFYPVIEVNRKREVRKVTLLLLDDSLSLALKDGYRGSPEKLRLMAAGMNLEASQVTDSSRADLVNRLLQDPDLKLLELLAANPDTDDMVNLGFGIAAAAVSGYACIGLLLRFLERHGTHAFAFYRIGLGAVILWTLH